MTPRSCAVTWVLTYVIGCGVQPLMQEAVLDPSQLERLDQHWDVKEGGIEYRRDAISPSDVHWGSVKPCGDLISERITNWIDANPTLGLLKDHVALPEHVLLHVTEEGSHGFYVFFYEADEASALLRIEWSRRSGLASGVLPPDKTNRGVLLEDLRKFLMKCPRELAVRSSARS